MAKKATWPPKVYPHRPTGQDRVRWAGRDYYLGATGSAEARANYVKLVARLEAERRAKEPAPDAPTVACVADAWRAHAAKEYGDTYEAELIQGVLDRLLVSSSRLPAASFRVDRLEAFRDELVASGLCRAVVNKHVGRLRTVWRYAERKGLVPDGVWSHLRTLPPLKRGRGVRETPRVRPAEWADVEAACRRMRPSVRGLVLSQWYTGARPSELLPMTVGQLSISGGVGVYEPARHKNDWRGQTRTIVFGPQALAAIAGLLANRGEGDLVYPNRDGSPYNRISYYQSVSRACKAAGVKFHPYQLRHAAKRRITREMGLDAARAALGQASLSTTDRYAAGGDEKTAGDVARKCG
jgi:integrase